MLLVVFGAGASYDSAPTYRPEIVGGNPARPPLASQLFEDKPRFAMALREFSECQALVPYLRHPTPEVSVEQLLQQYLEEAESDPVRYQQLAAIRYYLHRILGREQELEWQNVHGGVTNYKSLLEELRTWHLRSAEKVCLVTFNYDTMLEAALGVIGVHIKEIPDYISNENYKIIKAHGSVHWVRELNTPLSIEVFSQDGRQIVHALIERAASLDISNRFHILRSEWPAELPPRNGDRIGAFPAIAIPVTSKSSFECPPDHLEALRGLLPEVRKIITIGWRAKEQHFLNLVRKHPGHRCNVMVIAQSETEAKTISSELFDAGIGDKFFQGRLGFSNAVLTGEIRRFLFQ